jgi:HlyD family secretion protein
VRAAAFPDAPLQGRVEGVSLSLRRPEIGFAPGAAASARAYTVKVRLASRDRIVLRPGMTCRAEIYTSTTHGAVAVPVQAVLTNNQAGNGAPEKQRPGSRTAKVESHVFVVQNDRVSKRIVKTGLSDDSYQQIVGGLNAGETVVVGPYEDLRYLAEGEPVSTSGAGAARQ